MIGSPKIKEAKSRFRLLTIKRKKGGRRGRSCNWGTEFWKFRVNRCHLRRRSLIFDVSCIVFHLSVTQRTGSLPGSWCFRLWCLAVSVSFQLVYRTTTTTTTNRTKSLCVPFFRTDSTSDFSNF